MFAGSVKHPRRWQRPPTWFTWSVVKLFNIPRPNLLASIRLRGRLLHLVLGTPPEMASSLSMEQRSQSASIPAGPDGRVELAAGGLTSGKQPTDGWPSSIGWSARVGLVVVASWRTFDFMFCNSNNRSAPPRGLLPIAGRSDHHRQLAAQSRLSGFEPAASRRREMKEREPTESSPSNGRGHRRRRRRSRRMSVGRRQQVAPTGSRALK